jgi:hypothetical protein
MITEDIVAAVRGRFLKKDLSSGWIVISGPARRVKVAQALQYRQRRLGEGQPSHRPRPAVRIPSHGPCGTALFHDSRSSFASCVSSGSSVPSSALDNTHLEPDEIVSMPCVTSTKSEQSHVFTPEPVGSNICLGVVPTSVMSEATEPSTDDSFDPCDANEPVHVSDDELLWALGYPSKACRDEEDVEDNCSIGYTRDEYERQMSVTMPDESKSCCLMQSRAPVSPDHESRLTPKKAFDLGASRGSYAQPVTVPSTAPALPDIDIFSALEQAGFLENADCSEK